MKNKFIMYAAAACLLCSCGSQETQRFQTDYFGLDIDEKGYIVGMWNTTRESRNFSPADRLKSVNEYYFSRKGKEPDSSVYLHHRANRR